MPDNLGDKGNLACQDKARYSTQKEAIAAAVVAKYQHGSRLNTYKCKHCELWHLATNYED